MQNKRKAKSTKDSEVSDDHLENLEKIKKVFEILKSANSFKLAPVRILKEEGKDGHCVTRSRPRRRSTLKKSKVTQFREQQGISNERRRSIRIQENLKRNSKEFQLSAFVANGNQVKNEPSKAVKFNQSFTPVKSVIEIEEKKEDMFTENDHE